ncbi:MAG: hypothetical protein H0T57_17025 [Rubrobacter sp.]|nr:hypothetical protein [Rubrobacter sp.]
MSNEDMKPAMSPDPSPSRRFSRQRLLASAGTALGAFALGARPALAAGDDAASETRGNGPSPASAVGQGTVRFPDGFLWGTASAALHVEGTILRHAEAHAQAERVLESCVISRNGLA